MAKVPIERQIMALADLIEHAEGHDHDKEAAEAALRTLEYAQANRRHFELVAQIIKHESVQAVLSEFPGAEITDIRPLEERDRGD